MKIGVLKELNDKRVSMVPASVKRLSGQHSFFIEKDAGKGSMYNDSLYREAGASISARNNIIKKVDVLLSIHPLKLSGLQARPNKSVYISSFRPFADEQIVNQLRVYSQYIISLDMIPRISIAQSMDVLSSMASIAGYKAVLLAATNLPRYFPMLITSAGSVRPAKVFVIGAGVAGLQSIATAKRLGASVCAVDTRSAAKEEVKSLGATFLDVEGAKDATSDGYASQQTEEYVQRQRAMVASEVTNSDVVICTAVVRGSKAPVIISKDMVESMKPGSVIVDMASSIGGNTSLTRDEETVEHKGVKIMGYSNLPATLPQDASRLYSNNVTNFIEHLTNKSDKLLLNEEDAIFQQSCIVRPNKP